ncbi:MAG TPA: methyltransferase domain-containing protein [Bryobacteraceae bacterium]|nr:methyltransferase domain-containing protein [Bryobacteraceae bacterium]
MNSRVYQSLGRLLAPGGKRIITQHLQPHPGRALDVGCGAWSCLSLIGMKPYGVDISADCVRVFHRGVVASAIALPFVDGCFDSVWSFGLLHHLPDQDARAAICEMRRVTRAGGRTIVFDGVLPRRAWLRPLAWLIRRLDRGHWMRHRESLDALIDSTGAWQRQRFTYAYTGLEGVLYTYAGS